MPSVLITGCSSGIGHATALRLAASKRWTVYATARRVSDLRALEAAGCRTMALDVTDEASMQATVAAIESNHGHVAVLVNNAGYSQSGAVETIPLDLVRAQFETNVFGVIRLTQLVLPGMRRAGGGRIINLSSMGGRLVFPGGGVYHATKYAIEALTDALRFEVAGWGIQVVAVQPGLIRTKFAETAVSGITRAAADEYRELHEAVARSTADAYKQGIAVRLSGTPEDVAEVIEEAMTAERPKTRYTVAPSARVFMRLRRLLGDRGWDRILRRVYPVPGAKRPEL
jgi:NAD(P)-dependent dehydrogenase (short-subunit alcohol dehydrogenase family)